MAVYRITEKNDGTVEIWARFTPFKGAATKHHIARGKRGDVGAMAMQAAEWAKEQRKPK